MQRRSTRLKENPVKLMTEEPDMDDSAEVDEALADEPAVTEKKPRGRKRKAAQDKDSKAEGQPQTKRPRGKRGLLKQLVEMPLDVLFEIFGQLEPLDLLHLSRTTKDVRALLMSRSSISIWKQSRTNIAGMPECPEDLSEPQYAELAFGKRCYDCQRNLSTNRTVWSARVRYCTKCLDKHFVDTYHAFSKWPTELDRLIPAIVVIQKIGRRMRNKTLICRDVDTFWREEYKKCETPEDIKNWFEKKILEQKTIIAHGKSCTAWFANLRNVRELQKASLVDDRKAMVVERLKKLGWGYELERIPESYDQPQDDSAVVKACQKELTERVLSNLEDHLNRIMEKHKARRVAQERNVFLQKRLPLLHQVYNTYVSTLPATAICPNTADIFRVPLVRDAINNLPSDIDLSEDHYDVIRQSFPEVVLQWQKQAEEALIAMITKSCPEYFFDPEKVLHLATTFFYCPACTNLPRSRSIRHTRAMMHDCTRVHAYTSPADDPDIFAVKEAIHQFSWNWNKKISFLPETLKLMTDVLEACGFDPKTTTAQEMDAANPIIECISCNDLRQGRLTMAWAGVIAHDHEKHNHPYREDKHPMNFVVLGEQEAAFVRARMAESQARSRADRFCGALACNHCKTKGNTIDLEKHVKQDHGRAIVTSEDIVPSIDYCHVPPLYYLWPPRPEGEQRLSAEAAMETH